VHAGADGQQYNLRLSRLMKTIEPN
jgi:hypothetical protein